MRFLKFLAIVLAAVILFFNIWSYAGGLDAWLGMNDVRQFIDALETSYGNAPRILRPKDPAWQPTIDLIRRYSKVPIPQERPITFIGRFRAVASYKMEIGSEMFQWTAPATPFAVFFYPGSERDKIPNNEFLIVGTLGDLRSWIDRRISDYKIFFLQFISGGLSILLTLWLWFLDLGVNKKKPAVS
jgi:hypothetical protein